MQSDTTTSQHMKAGKGENVQRFMYAYAGYI